MIPQENIEREFYRDVRSKKSLVPSAKHIKKGSKTKFVSLPHDHMTTAQWKKLNGKVQEFNMNKPMNWKEFKQLPADLMGEYIVFLQNEFHASASAIAEALDITYCSFKRVIDEKHVSYNFPHAFKQPEADHERMYLFFHPEEAIENTDSDGVQEENTELKSEPVSKTPAVAIKNECEISEQHHVEQMEVADVPACPPLFRSNMSNFSMEFDGPYDEMSLLNTMRLMVGTGTSCKIKITVEKGDEIA